MLEKLLNSENGVTGICVLLALHLAWRVYEWKNKLSEDAVKDLTTAMRENTFAIKHLESVVAEFPKMKTDITRFYTAIKELAGDKWPQIRKEILEEDRIL